MIFAAPPFAVHVYAAAVPEVAAGVTPYFAPVALSVDVPVVLEVAVAEETTNIAAALLVSVVLPVASA